MAPVYKWFLNKKGKNVTVFGEMIKMKAIETCKKLYPTQQTFNASNGWLDKFKTRSGKRHLTICEEKLFSGPELVEPFRIKLVEEKHLAAQQIYNADEFGLCWKMLTYKTFVSILEKTRNQTKQAKINLLGVSKGRGKSQTTTTCHRRG